MDNLRIVLIVIASLVIIALLIHGFLINKKERSPLFSSKQNNAIKDKQKALTSIWQEDNENSEFTDSVNKENITPNQTTKEFVISEVKSHIMTEKHTNGAPVQRDFFGDNDSDLPTEQEKNIVINQLVINQAKPNNSAYNKNESSLVSTADDETSTPDTTSKDSVTTEQSDNKPKTETKKTDVLVFHITGLNNTLLRGDLLLSSIIQSGFRFGEMQIFHRHLDPAGNGPVLFSLANMMKPGTLDPETMHEFTTLGVSIFMMIPSYGNSQQNFKLMLQTVQRIADDVNGIVLDDEHHMLTPQKIDNYKERIKAVTAEKTI